MGKHHSNKTKKLASKQKQAIRVIYAAEHANEKNVRKESFKYLQTQHLASTEFSV